MTQPPTIRSLVLEWEERKANMYAQDAYSYNPYGTALGDAAKQLAALLDAHYAFLETGAKVSSNFSRIKAIKEMCEQVLGKPEE